MQVPFGGKIDFNQKKNPMIETGRWLSILGQRDLRSDTILRTVLSLTCLRSKFAENPQGFIYGAMAHKRNLIYFLLVICIGFMPAYNLVANEMQHQHSTSTDCLDCDPMEMAVDLPCNNENCPSMAQACSPCSSIGFIPENPSHPYGETLQLAGFLPAYTKFGSHSENSIYRPPIA